ncbi:hypothetical protein DFO83_104215 [Idiomarina loihiensis]|uniref:hypothetical protein n=1 Tax=Idiomarina TaxID=135575 RepID=UPI000556DFE1|nr:MULTISPECIES: hypothetical protein [Idiomarina]NWO03849.1 hypothetical protein [Idiomarinaceae bacterium]PWW38515.1 hypothetical protein DFO83_104215 [Idiomarina loihiensis]TDP48411.1 hypothetical protein DET58_10488 [Idiomarina loihiensis]TDS23577.1 hypothetical protein DET62_10488 [Idiomarina sp. H2]
MKIDINELLKLEDKTIARLGLLVTAAMMFISPAAFIFLFEGAERLLEYSTPIVLLIFGIVSVPFHILGGITYLHPYKTQWEISQGILSSWAIVLGAGMWSSITAIASYGLVHGLFIKQLSEFDPSIPVLYVLAWFCQIAPMSLLLFFNNKRLSRAPGNKS